MVLLESVNVPLGTPAPEFQLPGIDNETHTLDEYNRTHALVIVFMCNHCPYVQGVIGRLIALQDEFKDKNVQFIGINANESDNYPEDSFEKMSEYAKKWGMNFPYLRDETQEVAKKYNAQCTPDIFVYDNNHKLIYHGRVDDNWQEPDKVEVHDLRDALTAFVEGKEISPVQYPSIGCSIKWKS